MQKEELSQEELSALLGSYMPEIQGYRVLRQIGKGGMSYVYLGVQVSLDRQVAIKVMSPSALADEKSKQRFEQEARTIAKLEHPCIVGIHEVGRTPQGLMYYVMPYLAKGHLGQRDFSQEEARAVDLLRALLSALEYAHTRGIVHRDVKAENVLFDNADRPLLTDFGIALTRKDSTRITTAGLAIGSGGYMAPEQARGEPVDGRADLYSVGVLTFEILSGKLPYESSDPLGLALMHAQDPIPRLPAAHANWQAFIDRAMAKSPENRFRNAQQMLVALNQIAGGGKQATTQQATPSVPAVSRPAAKPAVASTADPAPAPGPIAHPPAARRISPQFLALVLSSSVLLVALVLLWMRSGNKPETTNQDFFTPTAQAPVAQPAVAPAPVPVPAAPTDATSNDGALTQPPAVDAAAEPVAEPVAEAPPPVEAVPVPESTEVAAGSDALPWAKVAADVTVVRLDYDPNVPGARQLIAARRQLDKKQLATPPGDNVIDSLMTAKRLAADPLALAKLNTEAISTIGKFLVEGIRAGRDDTVRTTYSRTQQFARDTGQTNAPGWKFARTSLVVPLVARLEAATQHQDRAAIDRTKALAQSLDVVPTLLEPAWSAAVVVEKPAPVVRSSGPAMVSIQPGLAVMRNKVTRAEYAQFTNATQRPVTRCRNRLAPITIKKRLWTDPGFVQTDSHPVVCISHDDAAAYAQWLGQRTGNNYRLPTVAEWQLIAGYRGNADPCQDGRLDCSEKDGGTVPASQGPASPTGLNGLHGNAREWLEDCAGGCNRRQVAGLGWRDKAGRSDAVHASAFDARVGFDDIGFRLVRADGKP